MRRPAPPSAVNRLCLGAVHVGPHATGAASFASRDRAPEHGIKFIDAANIRQSLGRPGKVRGAASGVDKSVVVRHR